MDNDKNPVVFPWRNDVKVKHTMLSAQRCGIDLNSDLKENVEQVRHDVHNKYYQPVYTENSLKIDNIMPENNKSDESEGVQKKLDFANMTKVDEKVIRIQRYMFGTDMWFTGLGMNLGDL